MADHPPIFRPTGHGSELAERVREIIEKSLEVLRGNPAPDTFLGPSNA